MCEHVLGSGAAIVREALSLCFHLTCFQVRGHGQVKDVAAINYSLLLSPLWGQFVTWTVNHGKFSFNLHLWAGKVL